MFKNSVVMLSVKSPPPREVLIWGILKCCKFEGFDTSPSSVCLTTYSFNQNKTRSFSKKAKQLPEMTQSSEVMSKNYVVAKRWEFYYNANLYVVSRNLFWHQEPLRTQKQRFATQCSLLSIIHDSIF